MFKLDDEYGQSEEKSSVLKYKIEDGEIVDEFSFSMINHANIDGLFPLGRTKTEFLVPVDSCITAREYIAKEKTLERISNVLTQVFKILESKEDYMLEDSPIINDIKYTYIRENKVMLICIPSNYAKAYVNDEREYVRQILSSVPYKEEDYNSIIDLLNLLNSTEYTKDHLIELLSEILTAREEQLVDKRNKRNKKSKRNRRNKIDEGTDETYKTYETEETEKDTLEETKQDELEINADFGDKAETTHPKKRGLFRRIFGSSEYEPLEYDSNNMDEGHIGYSSELPPGVNVLVVRSTKCEYPLCFGPDIIGTDPDTCSICLPNGRGVDEKHCRVYFDKGRFQLEDLGSSTGTYLNASKLDAHKPKAMSPADFIKVGKEELVFSHR